MKKKKNNEKVISAEKTDIDMLKKPENENKFFFFIIILAGLIVIVLICTIAWNIGNTAGALTGKAKGSFDGITEGGRKGYEAGREEGLSAKDTKVDIAGEIKKIGRLEVLTVESEIVDNFEIGNDYKALFVYKGIATFSVDFSEASISPESSAIYIVLPMPEVEFRIDENESKKIVEWQKFFWSGDKEAGYTAYMNSTEQIKEKAVAELENYDEWERLAKESAQRQVDILVRSASIEEKEIHIDFREEP